MIQSHSAKYFQFEDIENFIAKSTSPNKADSIWDLWLDCVWEDAANGKMSLIWLCDIRERLNDEFIKDKHDTDFINKFSLVIDELRNKLDPIDEGIWVLYSW
jgi:hypothetical protein